MEKKLVYEEMKDVPQSGLKAAPFPPRPKLALAPSGRKAKLQTNFFNITLKGENYIYVYSVKFEEDIPEQNTPLRKKLIRGMSKVLEGAFNKYFFTGTNLFSPKNLGTEPLRFETAETDVKYIVEFMQAHVISLQDIITPHKDSKKAQTATTFFNIIIKSLLSSLKMIPVGRTGKYLMHEQAKYINDYGIMVWPGYKTSVRLCESGLLLEVDFTSRILQQKSVYQYLKEIREQGGNFEANAKEALVGKSVIGWYGNKMNYVVSDIDFNHNPQTFEFDAYGEHVKMVDYFSKKYGLKIKDLKQPLIESTKENRDGIKEKSYLVPELCGLTGLPDGMREDHNAMKQVAVYTKLSPDQRTEEMKKLLKQFQRMDVDFKRKDGEAVRKKIPLQPAEIMKAWNLEISEKPHEVEGRILPPQLITLGGKQKLDIPPTGQFFFKQAIVQPLALDKWILVHTSRDKGNAEKFVDTLYNASQTFGVTVDFPTYAECKGIRAKDFVETAQNAIATQGNPQIIVFILPPPSTDEYRLIKKWAITQHQPYLTQMIKSKTLMNDRGLMAICSKVILQINSKRNGELWRVSIPKEVPKKTMMIGVDVSREGGSTYLGFSSSYDPYFCKYYTQILKLEKNKEICPIMGKCLQLALNRFKAETKSFLPELLVIYRDGVGESQKAELFKSEFGNMLNLLDKNFPGYNPKIIFATINKKVHTRFFSKNGAIPSRGAKRGYHEEGVLSNPQPGTVIHSGITDSTIYEYLLMPQYVNEGTGTPSRIQVLYDTSGMTIETFEELTNAMCYGYDNWQGAIRTPAPCKYALSHAKLAAKYTKTIPEEQLLSYKYFL